MTRRSLRRARLTPQDRALSLASSGVSPTSDGRITAGGITTPSVMAPVVLALALGLAQPAAADMVGEGGPTFTAPEVELILRNESLRRALETSPWAVHGALRILETQSRVGEFALPPRGPEAPPKPPEASKDPDIDALERVAPEAALDLFTLLKQAGSGQPR